MARLSLFIGLRYAMSRSRSQLVSFISLVAILGMVLGVALLIVVLSVMNGFDREMQQRILGLVPHVTVSSYTHRISLEELESTLLAHPQVQHVAPFIRLNAMLIKGTNVDGVLAYGIDPQREQQVSIVEDYLPATALQQLEQQGDGVIIGSALAEKLGLEEGDRINLMVSAGKLGDKLRPKFQRFQVQALLHSGTEVDQRLVLVNYATAERLAGDEPSSRGIRLSLVDSFAAPQVAFELERSLHYGYFVSDWTHSHGNLYSAIQLSRKLVGLMLLTIIAVAAFNVISALVMVVTDKRGDIAILRTMGAGTRDILGIFVTHGTLIGFCGAVFGAVLGILITLGVADFVPWLETQFGWQFLNTDVYPVDYVPVDLRWQDVVLVCTTGFVMSMLATIYPSWRAAKVEPAKALRYD